MYIRTRTYTCISSQIFQSITVNTILGHLISPPWFWFRILKGRDYVRGPRSMKELIWELESRTCLMIFPEGTFYYIMPFLWLYHNFSPMQLNIFWHVFTEVWKHKASATWLALIMSPDVYSSMVLNPSSDPKKIIICTYSYKNGWSPPLELLIYLI